METDAPIWTPSSERIAAANLTRFAGRFGIDAPDYAALWKRSVDDPAAFWSALVDFCRVRFASPHRSVLENAEAMPGARWFPGATLNFAEHLMRSFGEDEAPALIGLDEHGRHEVVTRPELRTRVAALAAALKNDGVQVGDRVAGLLPNCIEAVIGMLATTSLGAVWSSCSPDFGEVGVLDRFNQIEPKVLIACDGYRYSGRAVDIRERVAHIAAGLASLKRLVIVPYLTGQVDLSPFPVSLAVAFPDHAITSAVPEFTAVAFDAPLYVMYSSGTTGKPKCIVHSVGGTLLQHLKEHVLQGDLKPADVLFFFTTCGWMMWNWLVSGLATGTTLVLYDGSPFWRRPETLWAMAARERVTHFGISPKYLAALAKDGHRPIEHHDLSALRTIFSTGSPIAPEQFDYVHDAIKPDLQLASISGGTDIVSCFVLGNPWSPVYRGELQGAGLGMAVEVWDEHGQPLHGRPGELVCTKPFPSMPVGFWNDADGSHYRDAYFAKFSNVWHHGDYAIATAHGGFIIQGRSDATLNPGGVRIGTAEIYRVVDAMQEIVESVVVGHHVTNAMGEDEQVILFVRLQDNLALDAALDKRIKTALRTELTPRHVPAKIIACPEVPRTRSGKITEIAVRDLIHGRAVKNVEALANPAALRFFGELPAATFD